MTKIEYAVAVALLLALGFSAYHLNDGLTKIEKAGGWSEVFIGMGKEIKHIKDEINKD